MPSNQTAFRSGVLGAALPQVSAFRDGSLGVFSGPPVAPAFKDGVLGSPAPAPAYRDGSLGEYFAQNGFGVVPPAPAYRDGVLGDSAVTVTPMIVAVGGLAAAGTLWWLFQKRKRR